jgi:hypothetical protein
MADFILWDSPLLSELKLVSSDQTRATLLIQAAESAMDVYCNRLLRSQYVDEIYRVEIDGTIMLRAYPVTNLQRIQILQQQCMTVATTNPVGTLYVGSDSMTLYSINSSGVPANIEILFTNYPTVQLLADYINTLSGWSAIGLSYATNPSADLINGQMMDCATGGYQVSIWVDQGIQYRVDAMSAQIGCLKANLSAGNYWLITGAYLDNPFAYGSDYSSWANPGFGSQAGPNSLFADQYLRCRVQYSGGLTQVANTSDWNALSRVCAETTISFWKDGLRQVERSKNDYYEASLFRDWNFNKLPISTRKILDAYRNRSL